MVAIDNIVVAFSQSRKPGFLEEKILAFASVEELHWKISDRSSAFECRLL